MTTPDVPPEWSEILRRYWGFESLRPLQARAIRAGVERRDSLLVMPTGGGKSLCFQLPPLITGSLTVVVSPLIALMKDQVDALTLAGVPAAALNSHTSAGEHARIRAALEAGELRLLYVAPERVFSAGFLASMARVGVRAFAIDEAHCISAWGHDFRPEYRRLAELRGHFPKAAVHAFTATATPRVREDIAAQLRLRDPEVMVGSFDRANLTYRVVPRSDLEGQVEACARRHATEGVIVYCISRRQTEDLAAALTSRGIIARAYHAGLTAGERRGVQDAFAQERLNVVVATVAFGMGIDRSDVRCVVHAAHPKSIEAYQQETGRAGRDGLASECVLLYSASDAFRWEQLIDLGVRESGVDVAREWVRQQKEHVRAMQRYCTGARCRHAALCEHFGQAYEPPEGALAEGRGCGACDVCLGAMAPVPDAGVVAQKIVSCVARLALRTNAGGFPVSFGAGHIASILRGKPTRQVREHGHDALSTFGLLREMKPEAITSCIHQLVDQGALRREAGERPTIGLGPGARTVLRGELAPTLVLHRSEPGAGAPERGRVGRAGGGGGGGGADPVQVELFERLRALRRRIAQERGVPAFMIFGDRSLHDMAARRPRTRDEFKEVFGVGSRKASEFGPRFVEAIRAFCEGGEEAGGRGEVRRGDRA